MEFHSEQWFDINLLKGAYLTDPRKPKDPQIQITGIAVDPVMHEIWVLYDRQPDGSTGKPWSYFEDWIIQFDIGRDGHGAPSDVYWSRENSCISKEP